MGFFDKLKKINIFAGFGSELTDDFYDELEESLILADTGMDVTLELVEELRRRTKAEGVKTVEGAREVMVDVIAGALSAGDLSLDLSTRPSVVLFIAIKLVFWGLGEIIRSNHPEVYQSASVSRDASASGSGEGEDAPSFCIHCGKALPDGFQWGQFCPYCGEKVE